MRKFLFCMALVLLVGQAAFATPELFLVSGTTSTVVVGVPGSVSFSDANFNGWDITVIAGKSNSPTTNPGLDIASLTASCTVGGTCATLDAWLSDTGFTTVNTSFTDTYSATITGAGGSATEKSWVGLGNILFQSNGADGAPTVGGGSPIGTVGPFTTSNKGSVTGGPAAGPSPYSLTIEDIFTAANGVTYSSDGAITGVPEPASVVLLGGLLLFCSSRLRRKRA